MPPDSSQPAAASGQPIRPSSGRGWALALVVALGTALRLVSWPAVFPPGSAERVELMVDTDPNYHVLRAQEIVADYPHVHWTDPGLDFPRGTAVPWPPLFDHLIATTAMAFGGGHPAPALVERVAALLPVVLGAATILAGGALARALLGAGAIPAALVVAIFVPAVKVAVVGRPDQHVAELLLWTLAWLGFALGSRPDGRRVGPLLLGTALTLSFWNWLGSGLYAVTLGAMLVLVHVFEPEGPEAAARARRCAALGGALAAALLAASIGLWGPPGALFRTGLAGISGLAVLICAGLALLAAGLSLAARARQGGAGWRMRALEPVIALALAGGPALAAGAADGVRHGLAALAAGNSWYSQIQEFQPVFLSGNSLPFELRRFAATYGLWPLALVAGAWPVLAAWREGRRRQGILLTAAVGGAFFAGGLLRTRLILYLTPPLAVWCGFAAREAGLVLARRRGIREGAAVGAVALSSAALLLVPAFALGERILPKPAIPGPLADALGWIARQPVAPGREAVLSQWDLGHAIRWATGRPVVGSPFGTEGGRWALPAEAAFYYARSAEEAGAVLADRRVGWVLVTNPIGDLLSLADFAPVGQRPPLAVKRGRLRQIESIAPDEGFWELVVARLYWGDGLPARPGEEALSAFRLVHETPSTSPRDPFFEARFKVFEVVPGARLRVRGAPAGEELAAVVELHTDSGRFVAWRTVARARAGGTAEVVIPYATGLNGEIRAGPVALRAGGRSGSVELREDEVETGGEREVVLR